MMNKVQLSIVIPAYNEEKNIRLGVLDKVSRYLENNLKEWEVIIVDDGSTDGTAVLLDEYIKSTAGFKVIHNQHQGKADTVITGMLAAKGDLVLFSDLDQATPIGEVKKLLPFIEKGYDVVIGSRAGRREGAPITRRVMAIGFMFLRSVILGLTGITDTQCGFKLFNAKVIKPLVQNLRLYGVHKRVQGSMVSAGFDLELLFIAKKMGYRVKEVSVEWHYVETRRVNPLKDSWQGLIDIFNIRLADLLHKYIGAY